METLHEMMNTGIESDSFHCLHKPVCYIGQLNESENCVFLRNENTGGIIW